MTEPRARRYRRQDVWRRREGNSAVRYVCFESLEDGSVSVQSADFFRLPITTAQLAEREAMAVELFIEDDPSERSGAHPTLLAAIAAHDASFEN